MLFRSLLKVNNNTRFNTIKIRDGYNTFKYGFLDNLLNLLFVKFINEVIAIDNSPIIEAKAIIKKKLPMEIGRVVTVLKERVWMFKAREIKTEQKLALMQDR